ncbi:hypothetical protein E2P81_ATG00876 [Venturia nashicola]|uniref:Methyltransferase domain-containing protein n=1 Tax=Venturia nashicola TaxID=86259 RepID=A0A4Z1PTR9_9PEZI|nr:hypothetical protein E6O75_ATG00892 [Venturia nashicola]TLD38333.1 hypothetical protein E2P81_ATG00876 [Venturia nashicola]
MNDEDGNPLFAFQDLDYIPFGFSSHLAPYIETGPGTMRAAATLMRLDLAGAATSKLGAEKARNTVVCDLGCGDGEFLIGLLGHINALTENSSVAQGVGIDYNAKLIETAGINSALIKGMTIAWLVYDFNDDHEDLVDQLITVHHVTHVFIYLTPKQLALPTVRTILTRLCSNSIVVCCHKFFPEYLTPARRDLLMELAVYDETS